METVTRDSRILHRNNDVKRKEILEPEEVEIGHEFILRLISFRLRNEEQQPASTEERSERFNRDKNAIAQQMGYDSYASLPKGAKSFESRCSSLKRTHPQMTYSDIAKEEKRYNLLLCDRLRKSVEEELEEHMRRFEEKERRRYLVRRMCCYSIPFVFK